MSSGKQTFFKTYMLVFWSEGFELRFGGNTCSYVKCKCQFSRVFFFFFNNLLKGMLLSLVSQNMLELRFEEMPNLVLLTQLLERSCIIYQSNNHGKVSIRNYIFQNHIYFLVLNSTSIFVSPVYSYVGFELCLSFLKY